LTTAGFTFSAVPEHGRRASPQGRLESTSGVDDEAGKETVAIPVVPSEEGGCVAVRLYHQKAIVGPQSPSSVGCVRFHAAADIADEKR
jgi:hypothetical protein